MLSQTETMATMFQFHRHLWMIDFGSVEGSAISCWEDVIGSLSGGWSGMERRVQAGDPWLWSWVVVVIVRARARACAHVPPLPA